MTRLRHHHYTEIIPFLTVIHLRAELLGRHLQSRVDLAVEQRSLVDADLDALIAATRSAITFLGEEATEAQSAPVSQTGA